jgi:hypothetical protein
MSDIEPHHHEDLAKVIHGAMHGYYFKLNTWERMDADARRPFYQAAADVVVWQRNGREKGVDNQPSRNYMEVS